MKSRTINICQPGFGASCALCCGSHNYRCDHGTLVKLFTARALKADGSFGTGIPPGEGPYPRLFEDALQCPHAGFIDIGHRIIGCLQYHREAVCKTEECSFTYTCKNFSCHAREILTDEEIIFAARLTGDWYFYSLLINEMDILKTCIRDHPEPSAVPSAVLDDIKQTLDRLLAESTTAGNTIIGSAKPV